MAKRPKVFIAPGFVPHYRDPFYRLLTDHCTKADIQLTIAASTSVPSNFLPAKFNDFVNAPMASVGPFAWQDIPSLSRDCDLVIAQQEAKYLANYCLQLRRLVSPQKFAFWGHGKNFQSTTSGLFAEYMKRHTALHCDWWFAYNQTSADIVAEFGYPLERITSVMNAIDTGHLTRLKDSLKIGDLASLRAVLGIRGENVAVFTGGLYEQKRLRFLADACAMVRKRIPDFELIVIGSGPEASFLAKLASRNPWLHFVGSKTDEEKVPYWAIAKALLMPGLVGLVVLDSFALGVPIITTDYPNHSPEFEYLRNGENGIVCSPWPSLQNYADCVISFFSSPDLQKTLADKALASAKNHTIEAMARNFFEGITMALEAPKLRFADLSRSKVKSTKSGRQQSKNLCIVTRSLSPYTRAFFDCVANQRGRGATTLIIGRRESDWINPWNSVLLSPQVVDYCYANATTTRSSKRLLLPSPALIANLERIKPRLIAIQECSAYSCFAAAWAFISRTPYLFMTEIGSDYGPPYPSLSFTQRFTRQIILNGAAGVVALTPNVRRCAEQAGKTYILAPHAINVAHYQPGIRSSDASAPVVLMTAGNFIFRKGYDLLIKALGQMQEKSLGRHPWLLRCYGAGDSGDLRSLARSAGIADMVEFHSFLDEAELVRAYQSADAFVFPSRKETYGVVLHEAAACGLPLIATIHAGASELLAQEGQNAFCVDPENITHFASALEAIICDRELRLKFGIMSRSIAETWDVVKNAERTKLWLDNLEI